MSVHSPLWLILAIFCIGGLLSRLLRWALDADGRHVRRRRRRAIEQAQGWADAVKQSARETWPPRPEPHSEPPAVDA